MGRQKTNNTQSTAAISGERSIINLDDIVLRYAQDWFNKNEKKDVKRTFGRKHAKWDKLIKDIDWTGLRVAHTDVSETVLADTQISHLNNQRTLNCSHPVQKRQHILFRSKFVNDTEKEQSYNLRAERRTVSRCKISIENGYKTNGESSVSLKIPLPNAIIKSTANLKSEYAMNDKVEKDVEEELRWTAESTVKIAGMSATTAELIVDEDEYKGDFAIRSVFRGEVGVNLRRPQDGSTIIQMRFTDLPDLFTAKHGFQAVVDNNKTSAVSRLSRGSYSIQSAINQRIELHQSKLR